MTLSDVADRVAVRNVNQSVKRVMTVSAAQGLIDQATFFTKSVASSNLSSYLILQPGDFVYNKSTSKDAAFGVVARLTTNEPAVVTPLYIPFRARREVVDPDFLLLACNGNHFFGSLAGTLREGARAHGLLNVRLTEFFSAKVTLPPVAEQRRIVGVMSAINAHIEALTTEVATVTALMVRARIALLTVGPRGNWQSAAPSSDAADDWTVNMPAGWYAKRIGLVSNLKSGATPRRSEQGRFFEGGTIPWVKTGDLNERLINTTEELITDEAVRASSVRLFPADTVLVAMYGGFNQIGRTARLQVPSTTNQAITALTELSSDVQPAFIHEVLKAGRSKWRRVAASSRKDPNINKANIEDFDFPLPPAVQQREIVEIVTAQAATSDALAGELAALRVVQADLLSALLSQEITVDAAVDRFGEVA